MAIMATLYCLTLVAVLVVAILFTRAEQDEYRTLRTTLAEHTAKEAAFNEVARIVDSTKDDRTLLASHFLTESDTIAFMAEVESMAAILGIKLVTNELAIVPKTDTTQAQLKVGFAFSGSAQSVETFIETLEALPYHSQVPALSLQRAKNGAGQQGSMTLLVTLES
jgi:hypothetical protein